MLITYICAAASIGSSPGTLLYGTWCDFKICDDRLTLFEFGCTISLTNFWVGGCFGWVVEICDDVLIMSTSSSSELLSSNIRSGKPRWPLAKEESNVVWGDSYGEKN